MSAESADMSTEGHEASHAFDNMWEDDGTAFQPNNIPLKRVARAWERKPQTPFAQRSGARKVWRRVRMPTFGASMPNETSFAKSINFEAPEQHVSIQSPKKAVKKLCLKTPYGQDWRTTSWGSTRGTHARKEPIRAPIVLRSGTVIDPNVDDENEALAPGEDMAESETDEDEDDVEASLVDDAQHALPVEDAQGSEWEDIDGGKATSGLDGDTGDDWEDLETEDEEELETTDGHDNEHEIVAEQVSAEDSTAEEAHDESILEEEAPSNKALDAAEPVTVPQGDVVEEREAMDAHSTENVSQSVPAIAEPIAAAAAHEEVPSAQGASPEKRPRTRMSADNTAFLTAFLSRHAGAKKPSTAKRESLTNRRDSDKVRNALASPAKPEVLAELDANSPSPHKAQRLEAEEMKQSSPKKAASPQKVPADEDVANKPTRRSGRSRARPDLLLEHMTAEAPVKAPSKITIRGPTEQVSLKKSDIQELAAQTRANTRKNKAQSVMPLVMLSKLAARSASQGPEDDSQSEPQAVPNTAGRNVRWDETLVYFSKSPDEPIVEETQTLQGPSLPTNLPIEDPPLSPTKARSKRTKTPQIQSPRKVIESAPPAVDIHPIPDAEQTKAAIKPVTAPSKRRSRIATPAKGLLSKASLLPDDVTAEPEQTEPAKPATLPAIVDKTAAEKPAPRRALPTPKRSATAMATALKQCQPAQQPALHNPSPRKTSIPSAPAFAPRLGPAATGTEIPKLSFEEALSAPQMTTRRTTRVPDAEKSGELPGLCSPAKKRRRGVMGRKPVVAMRREDSAGAREELPPGLASPAKRRLRTVP